MKKCGDCIHADLCEHNPLYTEFNRNNPAYCGNFKDSTVYIEVVRCRDCKWYKEGQFLAPNKFCFRLKHPTQNRRIGYNFSDDDFCSYGERKHDEI